jgi:hypothetical protein
LTLPVAVILKRFFTPLLVFSLGIFVSFAQGHIGPALAALVARPDSVFCVSEAHHIALSRRKASDSVAKQALKPYSMEQVEHGPRDKTSIVSPLPRKLSPLAPECHPHSPMCHPIRPECHSLGDESVTFGTGQVSPAQTAIDNGKKPRGS